MSFLRAEGCRLLMYDAEFTTDKGRERGEEKKGERKDRGENRQGR